MTDTFDPDFGRPNGNLWGLPFTEDEASLAIIPARWDATVSFKEGARSGPDAILAASPQIDLGDLDYGSIWKRGIALSEPSLKIAENAPSARALALKHIEALATGRRDEEALLGANLHCERMVEAVHAHATSLLGRGKLVGLLGGDHSTPLGLIKALAGRETNFGILHIDAHLDLRDAYEGFKYSHASIMRNAASLPNITKFVHVGIRDFSDAEMAHVTKSERRHEVFTSRGTAKCRARGESWGQLVSWIVASLPQHVYISFDIDGLDPSLCPDTGTPVPGGLGFEDALYLIDTVARERRIVGFDLVEVAPASDNPSTWEGDWNANVGMRVLYRLACAMLASQG